MRIWQLVGSRCVAIAATDSIKSIANRDLNRPFSLQEMDPDMRILLNFLFAAIFVSMIGITTIASLDRSLFDVGRQLLSDRWFQATLCDAYFGFVTFYVWVCFRETGPAGRIIWFVLIMALGNIAMSVYVLLQLWRLPRDAPLGNLLLPNRIEA